MFEYGAQFTLIGSDGTTVVFNDGVSGLLLEDCTGFEAATIRSNVEDRAEYDSASAGNSFLGQRPVTLKGKIAGLSPTARNAALVSLQRALRGLRADLTLKAQPTGLPAMQTSGRVAALRITGGNTKDFLVSIICPDPRLYSQAYTAVAATQAGTPLAPGAVFSTVFPINFGGGGGGYAVAVAPSNAGNFATAPLLTVTGPVTNPQITNATSGLSLYVNGTLAGGETLAIDVLSRTARHSSGADWYSKVQFPGSTWWELAPGSNSLQLWGTGTSAATALTCTWRDAWA